MTSLTVAQKCIREVFADKRTVMMILVMPLIVLTLIYILFNGTSPKVTVGYVGNLNNINLSQNQVKYKEYHDETNALKALNADKVDGIIVFGTQSQKVAFPEQFKVMSGKDTVNVDIPKYSIITRGDDPINDPVVVQDIVDSINSEQNTLVTKTINQNYGMEDYLIIFFMEFVIFFFTFLIVGMSFLKERKNATLQRMLTYDISRFSIVCGYLIGFGLIAALQTTIVELYSIYVLNIYIVSNVFISIIVNIIFAFVAIALGSLISTLASTEFQIMQFIPIIILPQIIFSDILPYGQWYHNISNIFPLTWAFRAQNNLLLQNDLSIIIYMGVLIIYVIGFSIINLLILKRTRRI